MTYKTKLSHKTISSRIQLLARILPSRHLSCPGAHFITCLEQPTRVLWPAADQLAGYWRIW